VAGFELILDPFDGNGAPANDNVELLTRSIIAKKFIIEYNIRM
jgi:hypothetical protein